MPKFGYDLSKDRNLSDKSLKCPACGLKSDNIRMIDKGKLVAMCRMCRRWRDL